MTRENKIGLAVCGAFLPWWAWRRAEAASAADRIGRGRQPDAGRRQLGRVFRRQAGADSRNSAAGPAGASTPSPLPDAAPRRPAQPATAADPAPLPSGVMQAAELCRRRIRIELRPRPRPPCHPHSRRPWQVPRLRPLCLHRRLRTHCRRPFCRRRRRRPRTRRRRPLSRAARGAAGRRGSDAA